MNKLVDLGDGLSMLVVSDLAKSSKTLQFLAKGMIQQGGKELTNQS